MAEKSTRRSDRDVTSYQSFAGLRNDLSPERFGPGDLVVASNIDIDKTGRISRRKGYTRRTLASAVHSLWAKGAHSLFVSGTDLMRLNADYSTTALRTGLTAGLRMSYGSVNGICYFSNGAQTGIYADSVVRSWGLAVPELPTVIATAGALTPGRYQYCVTHVRSDGQESGAPQAGVIVVSAGQSILFSVPASADPTVAAKNIYLSTPDGEILYLAETLTNAETAYLPSATDIASLTLPLQTQFLQAAPAGQLVTYYKGRMIVASEDVLFFSEPFAFELFDLRKYIALDAPVTMLAVIEDRDSTTSGLFIGTERSCGVLVGSGPEDFRYVPKTEYGAIAGTAAYVEGADVGDGKTGARLLPIWLSTKGVAIGMPDMTVQNLSDDYDTTVSGTGAGYFDGERYIASTTDMTYVLRTDTSALSTYSNYQFNSFAKFDGKRIAARADGIYELIGDTDNGAPINSVIRGGVTDFGTAYTKKVDRMYVGYRTQQPMLLRVVADETATYDYTIPAADAGIHGNRVKLGRGLSARYWQFEIQNIAGADFELDVIDVKPQTNDRRVGCA